MEGTLSLLEAARLADVRRVVNFSSETVYGATAGPLTEEVPVKPSTPYAVTKATTEWLGKVYSNRYGLDVVSLRIGQVYGPGNRMPEVLGDMLKALTRTGVFTLAQGSDHGFNFIHVRDVALATERALVAPGPFAPLAYNISSGEYWRLGDVAALVRPLFPAGRLHIGGGRSPSSTSKGRSTARRRGATSAMSRNGRSHAGSPTTPHGSRRMRHDAGGSSTRIRCRRDDQSSISATGRSAADYTPRGDDRRCETS